MHLVSKGIIFIGLLWSVNVFGASEKCERLLTHYGNIQVSQDKLGSSGDECYVSIHPMNVKDLKYRDYLITTAGLLMVFNSYGEGPVSQSTGARNFYFFPRENLELEVEPQVAQQEVIVKLGNGIEIAFSTVTADIKWMTGAQVSVDPHLSPNNQGGVEIEFTKGLMLDAGFAMGMSPIQSKNRTSSFIDQQGQECSLKNSQIYRYQNEDVKLPHSDKELKSFLKIHCPHLLLF